jgi:indole-3-glycerol phosphate synthase
MILDEIMAYKRAELERHRSATPLAAVRAQAADREDPLDFAAALRGDNVRLIAEVKRASPSRGPLRADLDPVELAMIYAASGADAISVLTDERFFWGDRRFLGQIKSKTAELTRPIPILRKDFIFDPYQVFESLALGADALLLIAAVLSDTELADLLDLTGDLGMTALVEVHSEDETTRVLPAEPTVIGVNNRDLRNFTVDLATFGRLRRLIPRETVAVAESGIRSGEDVRRVAAMGADAILVGEALVTAPDISAKVKELSGIARSIAPPERKEGGHPWL